MTMNRRNFIRSSLGFLGVCAGVPPLLAAGGWKENDALPPIESFGLEGALPKLKGKVVYLDFWASWCAPCKASFPVLDAWQREFASKGFTVLGVSVDETSTDMQRFLSAHPVSFPVVRDATHKLAEEANIASMPTSFLIDRKGVIRHVRNGFHPNDNASTKAAIASLLA